MVDCVCWRGSGKVVGCVWGGGGAVTNTFQHMFGSVIAEVTVGLGPAGELRHPSYPEGDAICVCLWLLGVNMRGFMTGEGQ
jgi:hypothetical protein